MGRTLLALPLAVLAVVGAHPTAVGAQDTKMARGAVTAMAGDSVTVKTADGEMKFGVDSKTVVEARGAGTRGRLAQTLGQPGPKLSEVVKVGQAVEVTYSGMTGMMHAERIRAVTSAASGAKAADQTSSGTVKSVTLTSLTIEGSAGGGATFTHTFAIDPDTRVIAKGAGTAAASSGGKVLITDVVGNGDRVAVTYHPVGDLLHASEIRVTLKKK